MNFEEMLHNLLATIHRDGGHYTEAHGLEKSYCDAMAVSAQRAQWAPIDLAIPPPSI